MTISTLQSFDIYIFVVYNKRVFVVYGDLWLWLFQRGKVSIYIYIYTYIYIYICVCVCVQWEMLTCINPQLWICLLHVDHWNIWYHIWNKVSGILFFCDHERYHDSIQWFSHTLRFQWQHYCRSFWFKFHGHLQIIESYDALAPIGRQGIVWTKDGQVSWRVYVTHPWWFDCCNPTGAVDV